MTHLALPASGWMILSHQPDIARWRLEAVRHSQEDEFRGQDSRFRVQEDGARVLEDAPRGLEDRDWRIF